MILGVVDLIQLLTDDRHEAVLVEYLDPVIRILTFVSAWTVTFLSECNCKSTHYKICNENGIFKHLN